VDPENESGQPMSLNFQSHDDVPLAKPPLREVICQARFAPILEIAQSLPVGFQKLIREKYPGFITRHGIAIEQARPAPTEYAFNSPNERTTASLGINFVSLSTREYSHWDLFQKGFRDLYSAFHRTYGNVSFSRLGLRYINELTFENTGASSPEILLDCINDDLSCLIANASWSLPRRALHQLSLIDGDDELTLRIAFETADEPRILLDFDSFTILEPPREMAPREMIAKLNVFHTRNYDAFRWAIAAGKIDIFKPIGK
jgi:uncharacterized protein (TIGR04255 family)